jgi:respiratory burst oxidase
MTSSKKFDRVDRAKSGAARALKGLKFMTKNVGDRGWDQVAKRFDELEVDGKLPKTRFSQCIGMFIRIQYKYIIYSFFLKKKLLYYLWLIC